MTTLDHHNIAAWPSFGSFSRTTRSGGSSIATELGPDPDAKWSDCADALLHEWQAAANTDHESEAMPNRAAIEAAIEWLLVLRDALPDAPPTLITREPGGGIIMERSFRLGPGMELTTELTLYNDGTAENTVYRDGRVEHMGDIPFRPQQQDA